MLPSVKPPLAVNHENPYFKLATPSSKLHETSVLESPEERELFLQAKRDRQFEHHQRLA